MSDRPSKKSSKELSPDQAERHSRLPESGAGVAGSYSGLLGLQTTVGNKAVNQLLQSRTGGPSYGSGHGQVEQRGATAYPEILRRADAESGQPLDESVRTPMERTRGVDLGVVRVSDGAASEAAAESLEARAYTIGSRIHLGRDARLNGSAERGQLLAHEAVHTVQHGDQPLALQAKMAVSDPSDRAEVEADRVAEQAMRIADPVGRRNPSLPTPVAQPGSTNDGGGGLPAPPIVDDVLSSPGQPLDLATRAFFEPRFGHDFSRARIHTDTQAAESARSVNAVAFTVGWDVVLGAGQYAPETVAGKRLLAHELTHVIQQTSTGAGVSNPSSASSASPSRTVARAVASNYTAIKERLTYGLVDWAITDKEARQTLEMLKKLKPADLKDTVQRMEVDGLVDRLLENISDEDQAAYAPLIQAIQEERGTSSVTAHLESLLSYGFLDWAITDEEARLALETLKSLQAKPEKLKQVVRIISETQFQRLFKQLSDKDLKANKTFLDDLKALRATGITRADARNAIEAYKALAPDERRKYFERNYSTGWIANLMKALSPRDAADTYFDEVRELLRWVEESETQKASGLTDVEMTDLQAKYMESKRVKLAEEKIKEETPEGEVPAPPTTEQKLEAHKEIVSESSIERKSEAELEWLKKKEEEKRKWDERGAAVAKTITALANAKYPELKVKESSFRPDFEGIERRGKHVFAMTGTGPDGSRQLVVGYGFVEAAEADPAYVMSVVVHELFGHAEYGHSSTTYLLALYDAAAAKLSGYTRPTGEERAKEIDNFAYQGTEIYSLLRSLPYHTPIKEKDKDKNLTSIDPKETVEYRIGLIKENWDPKLAPALVRGLYVRLSLDPRITPKALDAFKAGVKNVFKKEAKEILK